MENQSVNQIAEQERELLSLFQSLEQLSLSQFDITISSQKMFDDDEYRNLVLSELYELNHPEFITIIDRCHWLYKQINQAAVYAAAPEVIAQSNSANHKKSILMMVSGLVLLILLFVVYQVMSPSTSNTPITPSVTTAPVVAVAPTPSVTPATSNINAISLPVENAQTVFSVHGSNTIGEKLAPALIEAYFTEHGITEFVWQHGINPVERSVQYVADGQVFQINLQAHGSTTAFKGLETGIADIGMSSRRVKPSEVESLRPALGDLSKVGNEHIIGLDGLAVIVNQNNPISKLSTDALANVFAGKINNWAQLGGPDLPIKLFARDVKSGTWDTFKNLVLKKFDLSLAHNATRLESSTELSTLVSQDEAAIGFIGLNYIQYNKALAISEGEGTAAIFPTRFTIGTEDYALARRLYLYTPTNASNQVKEFSQFAISSAGQAIVEKSGLISQNIKVESVYPMAEAPEIYNKYADLGKRLSLNFRFNYGDQDLDNKGKRDLDRLIEFMEENPGRRLVLMGYSDSIGAKLKNTQLSLNRAKAVEKELQARGIGVMAVEGLGEALPVANNDNESGRERNRRVEVWLL